MKTFSFETSPSYIFSARFFTDHQNWFGIDGNLGPVAISIRREKVSLPELGLDSGSGKDYTFMYRVIVRTSELLPLRGCILEESIPALKSEKVKTIPTKEVLEFIMPDLQLSR